MRILRRDGEVPLEQRLAALEAAAGLAEGRLAEGAVEQARGVVAQAGIRGSLSVDHTVVALAGATGSGKSSLFNALAGSGVATVGVTRPTTAKAQAALWSPEGSGPLLDWLDVPNRHSMGSGENPLSGLILVDLPDHDSIEYSHRLEVDRLVAVVDLLVWVLDPQKYADAAVHEGYLRALARHRDVTVVVLNQVDRLPEEAVRRCLADLDRLLIEDGLDGVPVVAASARTGQGLTELRGQLIGKVSRRRAWASRLAADVGTAADTLHSAAGLGEAGPHTAPPDRLAGPLSAALAEAAGVPLVVGAVAKAHRHRAVVATGWPVTRWLRRLRPDPLRRLRVSSGKDLGRTSLPAPTAIQRSRLDTAIRETGIAVATGVPEPWAATIRLAARAHMDELADELDRAVATTSFGAARRPRWWTVFGLLQWLLIGAIAVGALWLLALFILSYLRLPDGEPPTVGMIPWPTTLLIGGGVLGVFLALLSRLFAWLGGHRRARKAAKALQASVSDVGQRLVLSPAGAELHRFQAFAEILEKAR
ncbi:GTPase family protein [Acrocarpospora catenulata]|uniref:GTPase family protein n=1 Tax=Acrocarpospora catenulata TaxID=2836182 RepID=UPI001BDA7E0C|nr:YfjP family GTPase [Acrocarpospora catenulata]